MKINKAELIKILESAIRGEKIKDLLFPNKESRLNAGKWEHYLNVLINQRKPDGEE